MKKAFSLSLFFFVLLWGFVAYTAEGSEKRIQKIDQQIEQLEAMKRGYEGKALRHEDQAEQLQFEMQSFLEARRHNQLAEENRQKAARVQKEIDELKAERAKLVEQEAK